eukprot:1988717-Amphidinium_carterae.1
MKIPYFALQLLDAHTHIACTSVAFWQSLRFSGKRLAQKRQNELRVKQHVEEPHKRLEQFKLFPQDNCTTPLCKGRRVKVPQGSRANVPRINADAL